MDEWADAIGLYIGTTASSQNNIEINVGLSHKLSKQSYLRGSKFTLKLYAIILY